MNRKILGPKPLFLERMQKLLPDEKDFQNYLDILKIPPVKSIRCNKLKISPSELRKKLEAKGWKISQPWEDCPEIMVVSSELAPGELGRSLEHQLGYYYIQELASMLPVIVLEPEENELILDLCAAPGSKTTQLSSEMSGTGTVIANEVSLARIKILASNLERCGAANTIITRKDGIALCKKIEKFNPELKFSKILVDAPCSGEGTLRSSPKTYKMWNIKTIKNLPKIQTKLVSSALEILKPDGILIYSTCTHAPEENEGVVDYILKTFENNIKLEKIKLPIKFRKGIKKLRKNLPPRQ
jgi:NOL1/NOP2/sun family putative RNA methylase